MINIESKWLKEGEQTKATPPIEEKFENFTQKNKFEYIVEIVKWIKENLDYNTENKRKIFRKRTSSQILEDGFVTGCTDYTLVFIVFSRLKGIPTKYVEGINKKINGKEDLKEHKLTGHVVAKCKIRGEWYIVDPDSGTLEVDVTRDSENECSFFNRHFKTIGEGLDSWDLGVRSMEDLYELIDNNASK